MKATQQCMNKFHDTGLFLHSLKTLETLLFSGGIESDQWIELGKYYVATLEAFVILLEALHQGAHNLLRHD